MISKLKNKYSFLVSVLLIIVMFICQCKTLKERDSQNPYPIAWDVYGYYLYLPATFIYNDLGLQDNEWINKTREKYKPSTTFYQVTAGANNKKVIVYNIGYSFVFAPGFFIADKLAPPLGYEDDGFSKPYQVSLLITAFLLSIIGIFLFRKIALCFFSDYITSFLIITILLGSNYFFQATFDGVMPHNILFTLNCFIIWFTIKWHDEKKTKHILFLALFLGLATICRPTELIWILVPLLWNVYNKESLIEKAKLYLRHYFQVFTFGLLLMSIISIQFFYLKYATGYFRVMNLHNESFSFLDPYTIKFLFSYKKGWLVYTPIMIFAIIGFYHLKKQNKQIWIPLFLFFIINLYVVSSWECWWYAASFSQRPMVETYVMMIFPMGYFLNWMIQNKKRWITYFLSVAFLLLVALNLFQTWQFQNYIIDAERMTKKYYWEIFGKTKNSEASRAHLSVDRSQASFTDYESYGNTYFKKEAFAQTFEHPIKENIKNSIDSTAAEGKKSYLLDSSSPFLSGFEQKYSDITNKSYVWIRVSVWVYLTAPYSESNSAIVISTESKGKPYKYLSSDYKNFNIQPFVWTEIHLDFMTPEIRHANDVVKAYFWNSGNKPVLIDNFRVDVFEPKVDYE
jgi:hypothetical protein